MLSAVGEPFLLDFCNIKQLTHAARWQACFIPVSNLKFHGEKTAAFVNWVADSG